MSKTTKAKNVTTESNEIVNGQALLESVQSALTNRINNAENSNQARNLTAEFKMFTLPVIEYASANGIDIKQLSDIISISDKKHSNYLAIYALQKVRKTLVACAQGLTNSLDGYTRTIVNNLVFSEQNNKSALVSLSRAHEFSEFDTQKTIKARYTCTAGTAGTQMSSTRQALKVLNIATVTKNKNADEFALTDSALANRLKSMFLPVTA